MIRLAGFLIFVLSLTPSWALGQRQLANFSDQSFTVTVPLFNQNRPQLPCGEVQISLTGERLEALERDSFFLALKNCSKIQLNLDAYPLWTSPDQAPFPVFYDPVHLQLLVNIPVELERSQNLVFQTNIKDRLAQEALAPAPIGGAINYRVEKTWGDPQLNGDNFNTYFDSFFNFKGYVLESEINYLDSDVNGSGWFRGDTRVVKDFQKQEVRVQAGDIYPQSFGFMPGTAIGGIQIASDFTLNPYSIPFPQGQGNFILRTRSHVKTWVNGALIKDEYLPPGNYDLRDIPLINGLNTVVVETFSELGERKVYQFNLATSIELLAKGRWKYALNSGRPFNDQLFKRRYQDSSDLLHSGFLQYGFSDTFSLGGYAQNQNDYSLMGVEAGTSTPYGNFFLGAANSFRGSQTGQAAQAAWQLQRLGTKLFNSYTFNLRHQRFDRHFIMQEHGLISPLRSRWQVNFTLPIRERLTTSLGAQWGEIRAANLVDRLGYDATLNMRLAQNLTLSMFGARMRTENSRWHNTAYAFLTWSFDGARHLVNTFHDFESNTSRLALTRDNANQLYSPRLTSNIDRDENQKGGSIDATVPMPIADVGARIEAKNLDVTEETHLKSTVRLASAVVFGYDHKKFAFGLSRPVPNSFVIFKPSNNLADQTISLRSVSPYHESASGAFGEITYTNLLPYQYREIQLDPAQLDDGTTLEQERYVVYPHYRSAHIIPINDKGLVILRGRLVDPQGQGLSLHVGEIGDQIFFTDKEGNFFIEGLGVGKHTMQLNQFPHAITFEVLEGERGVKELGDIIYAQKENQ